MLRFMRKYATGWLVKGLFGVIIIVFIFWGVGSFRDREKVIAEVGPYKISYEEYQEAYKNIFNTYRLMYKDKLDENLLKELKIKEKVMDEIINRHLLLLKAKDMGIKVSDVEFDEYIRNINAFKRDGKFSQTFYVEILKRSGMDPKKFEESEKTTLTLMKITNIISDNGIFFDEADFWASYVKEKGMVNMSYIQFDPSDYKNKVDVDEKELQSLYEKEKGAFKGENVYQLKYIVIDEKSTVKDDTVYMDLLKFSDIDAYGKKNSLDVIDTGSLKESELYKKFKDIKIEEWIKGLKKGDISLPVRGKSKSYIFKLIAIEEGKPFDKAVIMKELREKIVLEKAKVFAKANAEEAISKKAFSSKNETGFINRNNVNIPKIGPIPVENIGVMTLSKDHIMYEKPIEISGKYYVFAFKDEKVPDRQEWEKNKKNYSNYIVVNKKTEYLKSFIEDLKKKEKIKINWKDF
ncbi:MAG: SurA N-terminal domain-containing protein [Proteobacteria bacterium]|nr:SurA N-terminal domain-containing protein [Pseudomonadota bacterium]